MGTGGAPEGVLTAAAMRCLGGEIFARLVVSTPEHEERCRAMGITDFKRIYRSKDLASGSNIVFAATGVTDGTLMKGVRFFGDGIRTTSLVMQTHPHRIRFIDSIHVKPGKDGADRRRSASEFVEPGQWRRNQIAVIAAAFVGFTGFTLVMPFLALYIQELGVTDTGEIALWTGVTLGVTPAITALCAPLWGRVGDRFGNKLLVQRSLLSFVVVMALMAYATEPWHLFALRALQGFVAGYGPLTLSMAALSAPREQMASGDRRGADGAAHRPGDRPGDRRPARVRGRPAQRVPRLGARLRRGVRHVTVLYKEPPRRRRAAARGGRARDAFGNILAFENFLLLMVVIFGLQLVDRSFGPVLLLHLDAARLRAERASRCSSACCSRCSRCRRVVGNQLAAVLLQADDRRARSSSSRCWRPRRRWLLFALVESAVAAAASRSASFGVCSRHGADDGVHRRRIGDPASRARRRLRLSDQRLADRLGRQPGAERAASPRAAFSAVFLSGAVVLTLLVAPRATVMVERNLPVEPAPAVDET